MCLSAFDSGLSFPAFVYVYVRMNECPQRYALVSGCVYMHVFRSLGSSIHEPSSCFCVTLKLSLLGVSLYHLVNVHLSVCACLC